MTLGELLGMANDWLRYAESKNAVFIAFVAGISGAVVTLVIGSNAQLPILVTGWAILALSMLGISTVISLNSFMPILRPPAKPQQAANATDVNPYFFGHAAQLTVEQLIQLTIESNQVTQADQWIAQQIVTNSRIAVRKFRLFQIALWFAFAGVFPPIALGIGIYRLLARRRNGT